MIKSCSRISYASKIRIAAAALLLGALTPVAAAAATSGTCTPAKVKFVTDDYPRQTSSASFVNISGAAAKFTQGGAANSCVIVYFSAEVATTPNISMYLRAELDDIANAIPLETQFIYNSTSGYHTHAASFIFPSVVPGAHTVRMQYRSAGGDSVYIAKRNLIVHFAP